MGFRSLLLAGVFNSQFFGVLDRISTAAAAAYSLRRQRVGYTGPAINVRRSSDNAALDFTFTTLSDLDGDALLTWLGAPPRYPLDAMSASSAAFYSLRTGKRSYSGPLVRVRRSSDNAEQDFYAAPGDFYGWLNTALLLAFCGSGSGYITTWYDQSGNGRHATQATATAQPMIVNTGALVTLGGKPAINGGTAGFLNLATAIGLGTTYTANCIAQKSASNSESIFLGSSSNVSGGLSSHQILRIDSNQHPHVYYAADYVSTDVWPITSPSVLTFTRNGSAVASFLNGAAGTAIVANATATSFTTIGGTQSSFWNAILSEVIVFATQIITADRQLLEQSQAALYGITYATTLPSGYVTTWYDQSGNGRHATQTTATAQPMIVNAGALVTLGGRPTLQFSSAQGLAATNFVLQTSSTIGATWNIVASMAAGANSYAGLLSMVTSQTGGTGYDYNSNTGIVAFSRSNATQALQSYFLNTDRGDPAIPSYSALFSATGIIANGSTNTLTCFVNGTQASSSNGSITTLNPTILMIGCRPGSGSPSNYLTGSFSECFVTNATLATPDRQTLERNQGSYYGITVQ